MPTRGISLLDLFPLPPGSQALIPPDVASQLDALSILEHRSTTSERVHMHYGTIQSLADLGLPALRGWPVQAPLLNAGLPFQLAVMRTPVGSGSLEPAPTAFQLDLFLDRVSIVIPGLRPAKLVASAGASPAHLVPDSNVGAVRIVGSGVLRIASDPAGGSPIVRFVDRPDPLDPAAQTGPVFSLGFEPAHFFIGGSQVGLTVDRLTYDDSTEFTPPEIIARGQSPSWRGIAIKEATVYMPREAPLVGDLNAGVRNVLLGSPAGLQGELRVEFGRSAASPSVVSFYQSQPGQPDASLTATPAASARRGTFQLLPGTPRPARVRAQSSAGVNSTWLVPPDHERVDASGTGWFDAREGDIVDWAPLATATDGSPAPDSAFEWRAIEQTPGTGLPPKIDVRIGTTLHADVLSLSGPLSALAAVTFEANPPSPNLTWQMGSGAIAHSARGGTCTLGPGAVGTHLLVLRDSEGKHRRIRIEAVEQGGLLVGTAAGPRKADGTAVAPQAVEGTYELAPFHAEGTLSSASSPATISGSSISAPTGTFAAITVALGTATDPDETPPSVPTPEPPRHVSVEFGFNDSAPSRWGEGRPPGAGAQLNTAELGAWAAQFSGAKFVVVGRCCDIGTTARNQRLAAERARAAEALLTSAGIANTAAFWRGEQDTWTSGEPGGPDEASAGLTSQELSGWLIKNEFSDAERAEWGADNREFPERVHARRADIYAVGGTVASGATPEPQDDVTQASTLRRLLVPGADTPATPEPREPQLPFRVLLAVTWESPTVATLADAIPTKAEITIAWQAKAVEVPGATGSVTPSRLPAPSGTGPEIYTVIGRWSHDARSGQTVFSAALNSSGDADGLFAIGPGSTVTNIVAAAMAFGPALLSGVQAADVDGGATRIAALVAAAAFAGGFARNGKVVFFGIELEQKQQALDSVAGSRQRVLFDYSAELGFDVNAGGVHITAEKPIRVRYKKVGIQLDHTKTGWDRFGLVYDDVSFEIEDPGQWKIAGPLGELLRVTGARAGSGSAWFEVDLAFALDLGVVTVTGATIRLTLDGGSVALELRGLAVEASVPGVLHGTGRLALGNGGRVSAGIEVDVIPAKVKGRAGIAIEPPDFVSLEVAVLFPVAIPFANSGIGLYGLMGRFVANGQRDLSFFTGDDLVEREVQWYRRPAEDKYTRAAGQWALGLGAVIGTMPDKGFTWNAMGSVTVSFPDPSVILGIDAKFLALPALPAETGPPAAPGGILLLGIVAIDPSAVAVGIRGSYELPHVVRVNVPISAYFPLPSNPKASYIRIGADGFEGRSGSPVTVTFLPGILDVTSWAYLMVEEKKLHKLGGDNRFNFDGFSIGFGAGWGIDWSAGPIRLSASAKVLVGVGTKPLMFIGGVMVRGELSLVVLSISAHGEIILELREGSYRLHGEFCGEVDLFFFSISGCVGIDIGSAPSTAIPAPPSPATGVALTDRWATVTAEVAPNAATGPTAWIDTKPVVHFSHYVSDGLAATSDFRPGTPVSPPPSPWSGTSELKYAYRLKSVELTPTLASTVARPLPSVWWLPSDRPGVASGVPASEHEGRDLGLMHWEPGTWARNLADDAEVPGDPANTIGAACEPAPTPTRACALGQHGLRDSASVVLFTGDADWAFERVNVIATASFGSLNVGGSVQYVSLEDGVELMAAQGMSLVPGDVEDLPVAYQPAGGSPVARAYRLPYVARAGQFASTLQFDGRFAPDVVDPEVVLAFCFETGPPKRVCETFTRVTPGRVGETLTLDSTVIRTGRRGDVINVVTSERDLAAVRIPARGLKFDVSRLSDRISVVVNQAIGAVEVDAYYPDGSVAGTKTSSAQSTKRTITLSGRGLAGIWVRGGGRKMVVEEICHDETVDLTQMLRPSLATARTHVSNARGVVVTGITTDGVTEVWQPEIVHQTTARDWTCLFARWKPKKSTSMWASFVVSACTIPMLKFVEACGVTWTAVEGAAGDQAGRDDFIDNWNTNLAGGTTRPLLEPNTTYKVKVVCQYQGWRKTDATPSPPSPSASGWIDLPADLFTFKTAAQVTPSIEPVELIGGEATFDPRAAVRYLIGFEPTGAGAPHFLDDPIRAQFRVDYFQQLFDKYDRAVVLKVRRTDLVPASQTTGTVPPDIDLMPLVVESSLDDELLDASDRRMLEAADAAPCLQPGRLDGATWSATPALDPAAEYDLLLVAPPRTTPADDSVLIARTHFRTSRYNGPAGLLASLGFEATAYPIIPADALVTTPVPATAVVASDAALDAAMRDLGLDPWPLPRESRTTTLWTRAAGSWRLAGLLLEADEALVRPGRCGVAGAGVAAASASPALSLQVVRSNAAGTRLLLAPASLLPVTVNDDLVLRMTDGAATIEGRRSLAGGPRLAYQEGVS